MSTETHVEVAGTRVRVSSPDKVLFPDRGWTKLDVVAHYLACQDGALRSVRDRPCHLKRWPKGVGAEPFYVRRTRPSDEVDTVTVRFASARPGTLWVPRTAADIVRMVHLNCIDLHPWPVRTPRLDHPDELRLDLDPTPGVPFDAVRRVALALRDLLAEDGLVGWPKTSGGRGIHVYVRIAPHWTFTEVRAAALALARELERRVEAATSEWWKERREGVFVDFNQMARDKTVAAAYSVRQTGFVSAPLTWDDVPEVEPADFPMDRFADRYRDVGDLHAGMEDAVGDLDATLARARADAEAGLPDAPWPPHYRKQPGEPPRVNPSRAQGR